MPAVTAKRQEEIKGKIFSYLRKGSERGRTWTELEKDAKVDGISKATLSRYLKQREGSRQVARGVDQSFRPPRVTYRLNTPPKIPINSVISKRIGLNVESVEQVIELLRIGGGLEQHIEKMLHSNRPEAVRQLSGYFQILFDSIITSLAILHVWISKFPQEHKATATEYMNGQMECLFQSIYRIGDVAPTMMKYREIAQKAMERTLREQGKNIHFLNGLRRIWESDEANRLIQTMER